MKGKLISGDTASLQQINNSYPGPLIRVQKDQKIRIRFINKIKEKSIVHWHGMHVPEKDDGHPKNVISPGETYIYEFEIMNRAGTYWYHPHPHGRTGPQVYHGMAGMLIVTDKEEQALGLPSGDFDIPVIIQDRKFDQDNQLVYLNRGMMERMMGFLGDQILINGDPEQTIKVDAGIYRFRLLNASNSRFYKLAWSDGTPLIVIGTDGGLLDEPKTRPYVMLGVAERIELWVDFSDKEPGTTLILKSLPFSAGMMGGMMGGMQTQIPLGSEYTVLKVIVGKKADKHYRLPEKLVDLNKTDPSKAINFDHPRTFEFFMEQMKWTINGRTWEMLGVTDQETVKLNTTEVWELINRNGGMMGDGMMGGRGKTTDGGGRMMGDGGGGGMMDDGGRGKMDDGGGGMMGDGGMMGEKGTMGNMMEMPHPIHLHQVQYNIIERNTDDMDREVWNSVKDGFVDDGWKDTVLLMPGMKIKIVMTFKDFKGLFLYHCHNLEHEDMGMMRNYKIV